ncbi:MAG: prepilin-type N-terminal cleavage/methylation domain-containing protein [Syntrophobacteria bacterium]
MRRVDVCTFRLKQKRSCGGFTLVELMVVIALIATLAIIGIPAYGEYIEKAQNTRAMVEIRLLEKEITLYELEEGALPDDLGDIGRAGLLDPWGNPYAYLNFANIKGKGMMRKDKFLVPLNSDYDLYSNGKDGQTETPLTAPVSYDDTIRANDGEYVGLAWKY